MLWPGEQGKVWLLLGASGEPSRAWSAPAGCVEPSVPWGAWHLHLRASRLHPDTREHGECVASVPAEVVKSAQLPESQETGLPDRQGCCPISLDKPQFSAERELSGPHAGSASGTFPHTPRCPAPCSLPGSPHPTAPCSAGSHPCPQAHCVWAGGGRDSGLW